MIGLERLVVDTSVVAKLYLDDEHFSDKALELFQRFAAGNVDLVAPFLVYYELPNAIIQAAYQRRLSLERAAEAIEAFFALDIPTIGGGEAIGKSMIKAAADIALRYRCNIYDAVFLVVAEALNSPLITADAKFFNSVKDKATNVVWIGDYASTR